MKQSLIIIACLLAGSFYTNSAKAQQADAAPDQNPRYRESERKYAYMADTLNDLHGTTIQNTYKAYDWYEAKQERRQQNRAWRHEERMNGSYYSATPWALGGGYGYNYPSFYGNYGYGGRWGGRGRFGVGFGW